jgi:hypothetical protein
MPGLTSFSMEDEMSRPFVEAAFYKVFGQRAVRLDILERVENEFLSGTREATPALDVTRRISSLLGTGIDETVSLGSKLGWEVEVGKDDKVWKRKDKRPGKRRKKRSRKSIPRPDSPFAGLATLISAD